MDYVINHTKAMEQWDYELNNKYNYEYYVRDGLEYTGYIEIKDNELKKIINGAYNRLDNYTVTVLSDYRSIIKEAKDLLEEKVEKKFADEILPHFTSTNQK